MAREFKLKDTSWLSNDELATRIIEKLNKSRMNPSNYLYRGFPCESNELEGIVQAGTDRRTSTKEDRESLRATTEDFIPEFRDFSNLDEIYLEMDTPFGKVINTPRGTIVEGEGLDIPQRITREKELQEYTEKDTTFLFKQDRLADSVKLARDLSSSQDRAVLFVYAKGELVPVDALNYQYGFKTSPQKALKAYFIEEHN